MTRMFRATRASWRAPFSSHRAHRSSKVRAAAAPAGDWLTARTSLDSLTLSSPITRRFGVAPDDHHLVCDVSV
jgi:hypothetical protein